MPYPRKYTRDYDFYGYQTANPNKPLPGDHVNDELNDLVQSVNEVVDFLKKFTAADGRLAANTVGIDQLDESVALGFQPPVPWAPATVYQVNDTVFYDNNFYICTTAHTSTGTFDPTKWTLLADFSQIVGDAEAAALVATAAATSASGSASAAGGSASAAGTSASQAGNSASVATTAAETAQNARSDAIAASTIANVKAEEAGASAVEAKMWAEAAQTGILPNGAVTDAKVYQPATPADGVSADKISFLPNGAGAVRRFIDDKVRDVVSVRDFGAVGDGVSNDTAAIQAAEDALPAGTTLYWPPGRYMVDAQITKGPSSWLGAGRGEAVIAAVSGTAFTNLTGLVSSAFRTTPMTIGKLGFDIAGGVFAPGVGIPGNVYWAITFHDCENFIVEDCDFIGLQAQTIGVSTVGARNFKIRRNRFRMPTPSGAFNQAINCGNASRDSYGFDIVDNECEGSAISLACSAGKVSRNHITGWRYGSGVTLNPIGATNVSVLDNYIQGGSGLDDNGAYPGGIEYWGFNGVISGNTCVDCASDGISVAGQSNVVANNMCVNNGVEPAAHGVGIKLASQDADYNASGSVVIGNRCTDTRAPGSKTQEYGIAQVIVAGGFNYTSHVDIAKNTLNGNKLGAIDGTTAQMSFAGPTAWGSETFTPGVLAPGGYTVVSVTVSGARSGDMLVASFDQVLGAVSLHPYVVADDTVFVQFTNNDAANVTLGAGTVRVSSAKPPTYGSF